jgi:hypothetical protein
MDLAAEDQIRLAIDHQRESAVLFNQLWSLDSQGKLDIRKREKQEKAGANSKEAAHGGLVPTEM